MKNTEGHRRALSLAYRIWAAAVILSCFFYISVLEQLIPYRGSDPLDIVGFPLHFFLFEFLRPWSSILGAFAFAAGLYYLANAIENRTKLVFCLLGAWFITLSFPLSTVLGVFHRTAFVEF